MNAEKRKRKLTDFEIFDLAMHPGREQKKNQKPLKSLCKV